MDGSRLRNAPANGIGLKTLWGERKIDPKTVRFRRGTAVSPIHDSEPPATLRRSLPPLLGPPGGAGMAPLKLGEVIGEGGMGVVYAAEQIGLDRVVAVKRPRADADMSAELCGTHLLREAKVTGLLEHPNVVPVYTLGRDDGGQPLIVMRRIQGDSWARILETSSITTRAGDNYLNRHLRILHQVAMAVHFAHDKGIVHRDLKPENIIVCGYGEVYVADWGVAVSVSNDNPDIPRARDVASIEGTPGYMAPEMAAGDGDSIDARTDVYLLGAILHEMLIGAPPHGGDTMHAILEHAFVSPPYSYGPEVPPELAAICSRSMQRFAEDRYPSAAAFARAIDRFLDQRAAMELGAEARERLDRLELLVDELGDNSAITVVSSDPAGSATRLLSPRASTKHEIRKLFNECRFAFEHVLRNYPADKQAARGLRRTLIAMIQYEMARQSPASADTLLRELADPPPELAEGVRHARNEQRRNEQRLKQLERDADTDFGADVRTRLVLVVALLWGSSTVSAGLLTRHGIFNVDHFAFSALNALFLILVGTTVLLTRKAMLGNAHNRRLSAISSLVFAGFAMLWLLLGTLGVSGTHTALVHTLMGVVVWTSAAVATEARWLALSAAQCVSFVLIWTFPAYYFEIMGTVITIGSISSTLLKARDDGSEDGSEDATSTTRPARGG